ncbi:MAG: methyltransferase domain-containing protein [Polyangiaceae bacterium]
MNDRRPGEITASEGTGDEGVPASTSSSTDFGADGERKLKTRRGKMTLRIPDDEVSRPLAPVSAVPAPPSALAPPTDRTLLDVPQAPKTLVDASAESSAMGLIERHSSSPPTVNNPPMAPDGTDIPRGFSQPPIQAGRIIGIGTPQGTTPQEEEVARLASEGKLKAASPPRDDSWTPYQPMVADRLGLSPNAEPSYLGTGKRDTKQTLLSPFEVPPESAQSEDVEVPISTEEPEVEAVPPSDVGLEDLVTVEVAAAPISVTAVLVTEQAAPAARPRPPSAPVPPNDVPPMRPRVPSAPPQSSGGVPPMRPRSPSTLGLDGAGAGPLPPGATPPPMRPKAPSVTSEASSQPPPRPRLASVPPTEAPRARTASITSELPPPVRPKAPSVNNEALPPMRPKAASVTNEAVPPTRPKLPSVSEDMPPPRPKSLTPPPVVDLTAAVVEVVSESRVEVPPATPSTPTKELYESPPPSNAAPVTGDPVTKKRVRGWWEDFFNEDYLKTQKKGGPSSAKWLGREVDFIEDSLGVEKGAMVLDLGCGEGSHAIGLAERGYRVIGLDASSFMVGRAQKEAQRRNVAINFVQADMRDISYEEAFDGVFSWDMSFGYFDDEKNAQLISSVHRALRKGGQFLLDVQNRDYVVRQSPSVAWFEGDGCICMDEMQVDWISSRMRMKRTMIATDGRSRETEYSIRIYSLHELGRLLHDNGFRVAEVSGRIETPGVFFGPESPRTVILAEKR